MTDAGIAALVGLRNLKDLDLRWTKVTGDCLRHICKMDGIEDLNLSGVPVTDEQLMLLSRLPKLKRLFLHLTGVPEDGIEKLMAASPSLALVGKDGHYYTHDLPLPE